MMRKIMILTSDKAGNGHKSAANALDAEFKSRGFSVKQIDCFSLMGKFGEGLENAYIPTTTKYPLIYYAGWLCVQYNQKLFHRIMQKMIEERLLNEIRVYQPDLIISVQCMFTVSVSSTIRKHKLNIPFYISVIDLINPPGVWFDKKADMIFVPTDEIRFDYICKGCRPDHVMTTGFPIRSEISKNTEKPDKEGGVNILMVNTSTSLERNIQFIQEVSRIENANITFICGQDHRLYKILRYLQDNKRIAQNIMICDFTDSINKCLNDAHIVLIKAGPNIILEAEKSGCAICITDHIIGQENNNYKYVLNNNIGVKCENPEHVYHVLSEMVRTKKYKEYIENTKKSTTGDGTRKIAEYIDMVSL